MTNEVITPLTWILGLLVAGLVFDSITRLIVSSRLQRMKKSMEEEETEATEDSFTVLKRIIEAINGKLQDDGFHLCQMLTPTGLSFSFKEMKIRSISLVGLTKTQIVISVNTHTGDEYRLFYHTVFDNPIHLFEVDGFGTVTVTMDEIRDTLTPRLEDLTDIYTVDTANDLLREFSEEMANSNVGNFQVHVIKFNDDGNSQSFLVEQNAELRITSNNGFVAGTKIHMQLSMVRKIVIMNSQYKTLELSLITNAKSHLHIKNVTN